METRLRSQAEEESKKIQVELAGLYSDLIKNKPPTVEEFTHAARISGIRAKKAQILGFLRSTLSYAKFAPKPARRKAAKRVNKMTWTEPGNLQGDLLIIPPEFHQPNSNFTVLLVLVDLYSRLLTIVPAKKKSAAEMTTSLMRALNSLPFEVKLLNFDGETSMSSKEVGTLLAKQGINLIVTKKAYVAESAIRLIKRSIARFTTHTGSRKFLDFLKNFVESRNKRQLRGQPKGVTPNVLATRPELKNRPKIRRKTPLFSVGNVVRIIRNSGTFYKESREGNWSEKQFLVTYIDQSQPFPMYELHDELTGVRFPHQVNGCDLILVSK